MVGLTEEERLYLVSVCSDSEVYECSERDILVAEGLVSRGRGQWMIYDDTFEVVVPTEMGFLALRIAEAIRRATLG